MGFGLWQRKFVWIACGQLLMISVLLAGSVNAQNRNGIPNGFNKVTRVNPAARQANARSRANARANRQPGQSFHQRNFSHHVPFTHGGRPFRHGLHARYYHPHFPLAYGVPYYYGQFGFPYYDYRLFYSTGGFGFGSVDFGGYSRYRVLNDNRLLQNDFASSTLVLPPDNFSQRLNQYNADRLDGILRQQANMQPTTTTGAVAPGLSIANKTAVPTDLRAQSDQLLAEAAFRERRYPEAMEAANRALGRDRDNGKLWLFSSQLNLALGKYEEAANDVSLAMLMLKEKEWFWVIKNFREFYRNEDYVTQIEALSRHIQTNPKDAAAVGLRGYHYAGLGYPKEAIVDLKKAAELAPKEQSYQLLLLHLDPPQKPPQTEKIPAPLPKPKDAESEDDTPLNLNAPDGSYTGLGER